MYKTNHYHVNRIIDGKLVALFATIEEVRKYMRMKDRNNYEITFMDENGDTHNCQIERNMKTKEYLNMVTGEIYYLDEYKKLTEEEKAQTISYGEYKQLHKKYKNERKKLKKWLIQDYNGKRVAMNKTQRLCHKILKMQKYLDNPQTIRVYETLSYYVASLSLEQLRSLADTYIF